MFLTEEISCGCNSTHNLVTNRLDTGLRVLSPASYNRAGGLILCCPMTSHKKGYPFEVIISDDLIKQVWCWPIKSRAWIGRLVKP